MNGRTRCTRDCPAGAHIHYVSRGWVGSWYTLEHDPVSGETTARFGPVPERVEVWIADGELRADPIICEECGTGPAVFHGVDGWVCDGCDEDMHPRFEG